MKITCEKCCYWEGPEPDVTVETGFCRRHAPDHEDDWPLTEPTDWCGEAGTNACDWGTKAIDVAAREFVDALAEGTDASREQDALVVAVRRVYP
jgi:hypothetical protein